LKEALATEEEILNLYHVPAEQSRHLVADIPRDVMPVAKKRNERIPQLRALLDQVK